MAATQESVDSGGLGAAPDGPAPEDLLAVERRKLLAITGVTSVTFYERQRRQPLNKSMLKVRVQGRKDPITVHCKVDVPNLVIAAQLMA